MSTKRTERQIRKIESALSLWRWITTMCATSGAGGYVAFFIVNKMATETATGTFICPTPYLSLECLLISPKVVAWIITAGIAVVYSAIQILKNGTSRATAMEFTPKDQ